MPQTVSIIIALIGAAGTVYGIVTAAMQMRRAARYVPNLPAACR